ncbi:MAG: acyl-CoA thioesterase [Clostridiaceae bacterium]
MVSKTKLTVRYAETDQMGIVYHANYYIWFEVARGDFIKQIGISYKELEDMGIMMPIIETGCRHYQGAKYDDEIIIEAYVNEMSPAKVIFNYNVIREEDNKLLAKGTTTLGFVDKKTFRIVNLKKRNLDLYNKLSSLK